jgi:hypothetical protein
MYLNTVQGFNLKTACLLQIKMNRSTQVPTLLTLLSLRVCVFIKVERLMRKITHRHEKKK